MPPAWPAPGRGARPCRASRPGRPRGAIRDGAGCGASCPPPSRRPTRRREGRPEVFGHVEGPGQLVAGELAGELEREGVAARLADVAAQPDLVAVDRAGHVAGQEVALVRALDVRALLAQLEAMRGR